ncbi:unnamed protein product [Cercospora beticola]|nr:unnamed protein product [Cercospora beticola]
MHKETADSYAPFNINNDSNSSSDSSSSCEVEDNTVAGHSDKAQSFVSPVKQTEQAVEIIVISSGDESSDLDDAGAAEAKVKRTACENGAKAAATIAPSVKEMKRRWDECKQVMQKESLEEDAPADQPAIEIDGILAAAIEEYSKLEDGDHQAGHESHETWIGEDLIEGGDGDSVIERMPPELEPDQQRDQILTAREAGTQWLRSNEYDGDVDSELGTSEDDKHFEAKIDGNRKGVGRLVSIGKDVQCRRPEQLELEKSKSMLVAEPPLHPHIKKSKNQQELSRISQKPFGKIEVKVKQRKPPRISQNPLGQIAIKTKLREELVPVQALSPFKSKGILKTSSVAKKFRGQHTQDRTAKGRISKKQLTALVPKMELSGRQQLLNSQVKLRKGKSIGHQDRSVRATDSNGKTKLARRNKRRRQNKSRKKRGASIES